jgi:hypothetical protein
MFDEIRCDVPLPDGGDNAGIWFQTKSFPDHFMLRFTITSGGRLINSLGNDLEPDGYISFYTTDRACDPETDTPELRWREYRARFIAGQLQSIVRVLERDGDPVRYGLASFRWFQAPSFMFGEPEMESDETGGHADHHG